MFGQKDIAEYYDTTTTHYQRWWGLKKHLSLHYGIWDNTTKSFKDAIKNTNRLLLEAANIAQTDKVLDAGCGVGGAAFYIHKHTNAEVTGVSLSQRQISSAQAKSRQKNVEDQVKFMVMDFTKTSFAAETFDVIWACESVCHAPDKSKFIEESFRLLTKGGRLVMCDFFLTDEHQEDQKNWIDKWKNTWAVESFATKAHFSDQLTQSGFQNIQSWDYTNNIRKSARRLYYSALLGAVPSEAYNLLYPKVSRFAKNHYKCGYYQFKALNEKLWGYHMILAEK
ncbi:hypothetical protein BKI52_30425 [marine bacterium AO1-C]|nr:hypothetical protein BKI52_30425 [marine bacterium AO1-C]